MKNFIDTIGNRTRDLPACITVLQPTALPRVPCSLERTYLKVRHNGSHLPAVGRQAYLPSYAVRKPYSYIESVELQVLSKIPVNFTVTDKFLDRKQLM